MDSVTHIVLGACIGEALLGRQIGKRAMLLGAVAQSLPDIDFIASFWLDPAEDLVVHRGITHSIIFAIATMPLLAFIANSLHKQHNVPVRKWILFFGLEIFTHLLLDAFNNYGVGWFEPFNHARISFNAVYVADPLFTVFPLAGFIVLVLLGKNKRRRKIWAAVPIILCALYLVYSLVNKFNIDQQARRAFREQAIPHDHYFTTPAPLQNILWMVVAGNDSGYNVGYRSLLDSGRNISFQYFPANRHYLDTLLHHDEVISLIRFSKGFYTVEKWSDTLVFNDLRFGQIIGWQDPKEKFVFHYFLQLPGSNNLVVQRGRFAKWNKKVLRLFLKRMWGQ